MKKLLFLLIISVLLSVNIHADTTIDITNISKDTTIFVSTHIPELDKSKNISIDHVKFMFEMYPFKKIHVDDDTRLIVEKKGLYTIILFNDKNQLYMVKQLYIDYTEVPMYQYEI